jgi:hypothetical protein
MILIIEDHGNTLSNLISEPTRLEERAEDLEEGKLRRARELRF